MSNARKRAKGACQELLGKVEQAIGRIHEVVGDLMDAPETEVRGMVRKAKGKVRQEANR